MMIACNNNFLQEFKFLFRLFYFILLQFANKPCMFVEKSKWYRYPVTSLFSFSPLGLKNDKTVLHLKLKMHYIK